jgi:hypothetical protein
MTVTQANKSRSPSPGPKKGLSPKARQWIGVGGLIACLLIGSGIVYWLLVGASPKRRTVQIDPKEQTNNLAGRGGRVQRPRNMAGITQRGDKDWVVRSNTGLMVVRKNEAGADTFNFAYPGGLLSGDHSLLAAARFRILQDPAMAKEWKITPEQIEKLKKVDLRADRLRPPDDQRATLRQLWEAYVKAGSDQSKAGAEKTLVEKLDEIARTNREPARLAAVKGIDEIKSILTADQIAAITKR